MVLCFFPFPTYFGTGGLDCIYYSVSFNLEFLSASKIISFQYIYIVHLESDFCRFSNITLQFCCLGHFANCVIPLFLRGSHPLPDQLPEEHTGLPSHTRQYLIIIWPFNAAFTPTLTHGKYKYGCCACSNRPHVFFYEHQSQRHASTHLAFL